MSGQAAPAKPENTKPGDTIAPKPRATLNAIRALASIARILDKLSKAEQDQVIASLSELKGE